MKIIQRGLDKVNRACLVISGVLFGLMAIIVFSQVASRFIFHYPLAWSEELARYLVIYTVFLCGAIALKDGELIAVEIFNEIVTKKINQILKIIINLIVLIFSCFIIYQSYILLGKVSNQMAPAMQIPMSVPYASIFVGFVLMAVNAISNIFREIAGGES